MTKDQTFIDQSVSVRKVSTSGTMTFELFAFLIPRFTFHSQTLSL